MAAQAPPLGKEFSTVVLAPFADLGEEVLSSGSRMGDEKRDSVPSAVPPAPTVAPRISRPVFAPPRPNAGGGTPAPRPVAPRVSVNPSAPSSAIPSVPPTLPSAPPLPQRFTPGPPPVAPNAPLSSAPPSAPSLRPPPPSERARSAELESKHARLSIELVEAKAALMRAEAERARLERALAEERSTREAALRAAREEATQRVAELERRVERLRELEARVDELEAQALEVVTLRQRNAELEAALATASKRSLAAPDDLKRLRGVGPAFERALRALGITTFAQIAEFTEADIERVAQSLKLKPERIRRDDWVGIARALLAERENG